MTKQRKCCGTPSGNIYPHEAWCQNRAVNQEKSRRNKPNVPIMERSEPDWSGICEVCGQSPIVPATGMCGPCTFGEADTVGGNW